ncbi:MAG: phosphate ABC transporter substrate-binding protein [Thermodesulfovibrionales bacterium]
MTAAAAFLRPLFALLAAALLAAPSVAPAGELAGTVRIGGTGSALRAVAEVARAFERENPGAAVIVVPNLGSAGGVKAVLEGAIDLGLSGRPLNEAEARAGLTAREYARTPFVFAVSRETRGMGLTLRDLARIYGGELTAWPDGVPIRLVLRPREDSDTAFLRGLSPAMEAAVKAAHSRKGMLMAVTDQESASLTEKVKGALGTTTLALIISENRALHPLPVGGAEPSVEALADGSYPYYKTLFLITGREMTPAARAFYDFVFSAQGRAILERNGHLAR